MKIVEVAVGVIQKNNHIFISKRADDLHQGGKWEFPGGKRESHESMQQALNRELLEEIGIEVLEQSPLMVIEHNYPDKKVKLDIRMVTQWQGEPANKEGQIWQWVAIDSLHQFEFPEANLAIVQKLQANQTQ